MNFDNGELSESFIWVLSSADNLFINTALLFKNYNFLNQNKFPYLVLLI